jgi:hypothetical protein
MVIMDNGEEFMFSAEEIEQLDTMFFSNFTGKTEGICSGDMFKAIDTFLEEVETLLTRSVTKGCKYGGYQEPSHAKHKN